METFIDILGLLFGFITFIFSAGVIVALLFLKYDDEDLSKPHDDFD